jgi:hypothetical protein
MIIAVTRKEIEQTGPDDYQSKSVTKLFDSMTPFQEMIDWYNGKSKNQVIPDLSIVEDK